MILYRCPHEGETNTRRLGFRATDSPEVDPVCPDSVFCDHARECGYSGWEIHDEEEFNEDQHQHAGRSTS